ncbi:alpha/beta hydrolase [Saccharomonospora azurea]
MVLAPMIPLPGETGSQWWERTGHAEARRTADLRAGRDPDAEADLETLFLHDLPPDLAEAALLHGECDQTSTPFDQPWPAPAWPDVPTRVVAFRHDRVFPLEFQRRLSRDRLGIVADQLDGSHVGILSNAVELTRYLVR